MLGQWLMRQWRVNTRLFIWWDEYVLYQLCWYETTLPSFWPILSILIWKANPGFGLLDSTNRTIFFFLNATNMYKPFCNKCQTIGHLKKMSHSRWPCPIFFRSQPFFLWLGGTGGPQDLCEAGSTGVATCGVNGCTCCAAWGGYRTSTLKIGVSNRTFPTYVDDWIDMYICIIYMFPTFPTWNGKLIQAWTDPWKTPTP